MKIFLCIMGICAFGGNADNLALAFIGTAVVVHLYENRKK